MVTSLGSIRSSSDNEGCSEFRYKKAPQSLTGKKELRRLAINIVILQTLTLHRCHQSVDTIPSADVILLQALSFHRNHYPVDAILLPPNILHGAPFKIHVCEIQACLCDDSSLCTNKCNMHNVQVALSRNR